MKKNNYWGAAAVPRVAAYRYLNLWFSSQQVAFVNYQVISLDKYPRLMIIRL